MGTKISEFLSQRNPDQMGHEIEAFVFLSELEMIQETQILPCFGSLFCDWIWIRDRVLWLLFKPKSFLCKRGYLTILQGVYSCWCFKRSLMNLLLQKTLGRVAWGGCHKSLFYATPMLSYSYLTIYIATENTQPGPAVLQDLRYREISAIWYLFCCNFIVAARYRDFDHMLK